MIPITRSARKTKECKNNFTVTRPDVAAFIQLLIRFALQLAPAGHGAGEYYQTGRERAGEYYEATRDRAAELYSQAAEKVGEVAQSARDAASRQTNTVAAAIDAGKKAYQEEKRKTEMSGRIEAAPNYGEKAN